MQAADMEVTIIPVDYSGAKNCLPPTILSDEFFDLILWDGQGDHVRIPDKHFRCMRLRIVTSSISS